MSFAKLDRDLIVQEAVALLSEGGLAAVSLRKVALRLKVSVSSLYWHVPDKGALYGLMSMSIFQTCLDAIPPVETWQQWLHAFGLALWDAQIAMPDTRQLIVAAQAPAALVEAALAYTVRELSVRGLPAQRAIIAQRSVQALVTGWTTLRSARPDAAAADRGSFIIALDILIEGWRVEGAGA